MLLPQKDSNLAPCDVNGFQEQNTTHRYRLYKRLAAPTQTVRSIVLAIPPIYFFGIFVVCLM